jgi:hypothetical protein
MLVDRIAACYWRLGRAQRFELGASPAVDPNLAWHSNWSMKRPCAPPLCGRRGF